MHVSHTTAGAAPVFKALLVVARDNRGFANDNLGHDGELAITPPCLGDEEVQPPREDEEPDDEENNSVHDDEGVQEGGIIVVVVVDELGVRKRPD